MPQDDRQLVRLEYPPGHDLMNAPPCREGRGARLDWPEAPRKATDGEGKWRFHLEIDQCDMCREARFLAGMYDRSLAVNNAALEIDEAHWMANFGAGLLCLQLGPLSDAIAAFERAYRIAPWNPQIVGHLAGCLSAAHQDDRAGALLQQLLDGPPHLTAIGIAACHGIRSEPDIAAEWFEKAIDSRHPPCRPMRESARWPALTRKLNLIGKL
jgi:tetratricopeptide (TPR) repeat protein